MPAHVPDPDAAARPADTRPTLRILGCRGVPAAHGGFETFAEKLALYLVEQGWRVVVYGQLPGSGPLQHDLWRGIERVQVPSGGDNAAATVWFDWRCISHARQHRQDLCLTLGYNTALFTLRLRAAGITHLINMDGIEWRRAKWSLGVRAWFWLNDWAGCRLADHLIADHPEIATHLRTRTRPDRISTILYGADPVPDASPLPVRAFGLQPGGYCTLVARIEPENSVLEIVQAYSCRPRGLPLVVVGPMHERSPYAQAVHRAAGPEVRFLGSVFEPATLAALRRHARLHIHGHQVGGTNPSLVEALAAGNPVLVQDNSFNRWVAGPAAACFTDIASCDAQLSHLLGDSDRLTHMAEAARVRHQQAFSWEGVLQAYRLLLERFARFRASPQSPCPAPSARESAGQASPAAD